MKKKLSRLEISPEMNILLERAIARKDKEDAFIASLTPEQRNIYIELWAERIAEDMCKVED